MALAPESAALHRLARLLAAGVSLIGVVVLFGWWYDISDLQQVVQDLPPMLPNEALSFVLLGATLFLLQPANPLRWRRAVGLLLAGGGLCLSIFMLLQVLRLAPIQLAVQGQWGEVALLAVSPQAALAFFLTSIGLLFLGTRRLQLVNAAQWAALLSEMALVAIFLGFAHKEDMFYALSGHHGMGLPTATAFALLGWGIILAKVEHGFLRIMAQDSAGGTVARRVIFLMAIFPPMLGWLPLLLDSPWLSHTQLESLLAAAMILLIIIMVIRLAYRLDHHAQLHEQAETLARQHQADLAHMARLSTMGEVASGIAHELNQPLAAIKNYASACQRLLQGEHDPARIAAGLEHIQQQALRASEIIRRLREFVRKQQPHKSPTAIATVVHNALSLAKVTLTKQNIPLLLELEEGLPAVQVDAIQIEQVILNIVQNAVDALQETEPQRRQILVRAYRAGDAEVQVEISDTGPGMDADLKGRVFDAFMTTKGQHGMGIGLALSRSIIEAHGGRLWVETEAGQGTTFAFTLPIPASSGIS